MDQQKGSTIFINPKFKNAYINPNFFKNSSIHVNPKFLIANQQIQTEPTNSQILTKRTYLQHQIEPSVNKSAIIKNTKRSLIRAPVKVEIHKNSQAQGFDEIPIATKKMNLIKIGNTKLVNAVHLMKHQQKENELIKKTTESLIKTKKILRKAESDMSIYKVDRRKDFSGISKKKRKIVTQYTVHRVDPSSDNLVSSKVSDGKLLKSNNTPDKNRKLLMVNINGVLYNATSNKLEKTSLSKSQRAEQLLIIRGQRFTLDSTGTKLKRNCVNENAKSLLRIDIGGLTYKKASTVGSYERDNSHQIRNHLTTARLKSISLLQRNQLKKSNEICPIYRRIGKCLAYAKGKCSKIHDHRYVMVCPKFLKGNCENDKCLLSHNVNFHKMPVCKYYLQGMCSKSKDDCPYLHKKLSDSTKLCTEFLKGYCPLADKCNQSHDVNFDKSREKKNYSINRRKQDKNLSPSINFEENLPTSSSDTRYFEEEAKTIAQLQRNIPKISKNAPLLPDYIQI